MNPVGQLPGGASQDPLAQLRDIHLPETIGWWPPAPGWWLLALLLLAIVAVLSRVAWQRWKRRAYRRFGEKELLAVYASWQTRGDKQRFLQDVNTVLKRVALRAYPGADVAALSGHRWTQFLDRQDSGAVAGAFGGGPLESGPYDPSLDAIDAEAVYENSLMWIRSHEEAPVD